jgi:hypothetical protein
MHVVADAPLRRRQLFRFSCDKNACTGLVHRMFVSEMFAGMKASPKLDASYNFPVNFSNFTQHCDVGDLRRIHGDKLLLLPCLGDTCGCGDACVYVFVDWEMD